MSLKIFGGRNVSWDLWGRNVSQAISGSFGAEMSLGISWGNLGHPEAEMFTTNWNVFQWLYKRCHATISRYKHI